MRHQYLQKIVAVFCTITMFYTPLLYADQLALPSDDIEAPEIQHDVITSPLNPKEQQRFTAEVTDNVGVKSVIFYYRQVGEEQYQRMEMKREGESNKYTAKLDSAEISSPGIEYYIQATDLAGNRLLHGFAFSPLVAKVMDSGSSAEPLASTEGVTGAASDATETVAEEESNYKWLWITLGVVAVGALAAGGGGGGGDDEPAKPGAETGGFTVTAPLPGN